MMLSSRMSCACGAAPGSTAQVVRGGRRLPDDDSGGLLHMGGDLALDALLDGVEDGHLRLGQRRDHAQLRLGGVPEVVALLRQCLNSVERHAGSPFWWDGSAPEPCRPARPRS